MRAVATTTAVSTGAMKMYATPWGAEIDGAVTAQPATVVQAGQVGVVFSGERREWLCSTGRKASESVRAMTARRRISAAKPKRIGTERANTNG